LDFRRRQIELAPCLNGKCEGFYETEIIRGDTKGNLYRRSIHDIYHGWYWQTVRQAKGSAANWMDQLDKHHNQIRIRITLKSNDDYNERHILDNLEVKGWGCEKPAPTAVPTAVPTHTPTPSPTAVPTAVPTKHPTPSPTSSPTAMPTKHPTPKKCAVRKVTPTFHYFNSGHAVSVVF
jgi:hypothetical protein